MYISPGSVKHSQESKTIVLVTHYSKSEQGDIARSAIKELIRECERG